MRNIGRMALCLPLLLLTSQTSPPDPDPAAGDFCLRLAANSGIGATAAADGRTTWTANALNFGQRFIFGGTAATGVSVRPVEPVTVEDYRRMEDICQPEKKGAVCKLAGPLIFNFTWKGQRVATPMAADERATVTVRGLKSTCRTEAP